MSMSEEDRLIKEEFVNRRFHVVPDMISARIDQTLSSLAGENRPALAGRKKTSGRRWLIPTASLIVAGLIVFLSAPVMAANYLVQHAYKQEAYVILSGYYYYATGQQVQASMIGEKVGQVLRVGDWNIKKDGDSNEFTTYTPIYTIKDTELNEKYAVKTSISSLNLLSAFIEVQRGEQVEVPDLGTIYSAKGDAVEAGIALDNIRKKAPDVYSFQGIDHRVTVMQANYDPSSRGTRVYYRVPEADTTREDMPVQGELIIMEYAQNQEIPYMDSAFVAGQKRVYSEDGATVRRMDDPDFKLPVAEKSFEINGILWNYYSNQLLRGEKEHMYYEIQAQGNFTEPLLQDLLQNFKPGAELIEP